MSDTSRPGGVEPVLVSIYEQFRASKERCSAAPDVDVTTGSPLPGRAIFVVGAPRSGTTWLQQLLAIHPSIATGGETHVFCEGVAALFGNHAGTDDYSGLSGWVSRDELALLVRQLVDGILETHRRRVRPAATHVLDKTPNHIPYAQLLARTYPDAAFVHIIRDGRDVATSARKLTAAGLWPSRGGYADYGVNARRWRDAIDDCREYLSDKRYVEVKYEDLLDAPADGLARIYETVGLPHDPEFLRRSVDFAAVPVNVRPSDARLTAHKYELSTDAERQILAAAGEHLVELGYVSAEQAARVLDAWTPRRAAGAAADWMRSSARRASGAVASRSSRQARLAARRRRVRHTADALTVAIESRDAAAVTRLLPPGFVLVDRGEQVIDLTTAARRLIAAVEGARPLVVEADGDAALARWVDETGGAQVHRMTIDHSSRLRQIEVSVG